MPHGVAQKLLTYDLLYDIMGKRIILFLLLIMVFQLSAQTAISGYVNMKDSESWEQKVYLSKLDIAHLEDLRYAKAVAWSPIKADGSFSFEQKHIADKNAVYRLYVNRTEKAIRDTIANATAFILSSADTMRFYKGDDFFSDYSTTNLADQEWKRLREFEKQVFSSQLTEEDVSQLKNYAKDSLRILMVKLIGIRQLKNKYLLDQDIAKNPDYYLTLLGELKESELPIAQYRFLEKRLAFLTQEVVEQKYAWSRYINFILGFLVLGLGAILVFLRKRQAELPDLSKQEKNIQNLILQGKTNKEIAIDLFISLSTVKTHITNIYSKLKVSSRQELIRRLPN